MTRSDGGESILDFLYPYRDRYQVRRRIPEQGMPRDELLAIVGEQAEREDAPARAGRVSGSLYHGGEDHFAFLAEVHRLYSHMNVLQRDMYPSATKFEGEIISMALGLLGADAADGEGDAPCGVVTFGGSESLFEVMLGYRERGRERGIAEPEVVMPVTAHVALDKAAHYLGVSLAHVPVGDDFAVDVDAVADAIGPNTVALVGSAGTYPHGVIDPIGALSELALEHDVGLHVDGCLGGFILPWAERLGHELPTWDFRLPGVTSISADTHKFGYAPKGTGVLLYRSPELRRRQYFVHTKWPGGVYASPGIAGSRSGGLIAATWAALVSLGERGYLELADPILQTAARLRASVESISELRPLGYSPFMVAFGADELDIWHLNDALQERGWRLNGCQHPAGLHFCVTRPNTQPGVAEAFDGDLRAAVEYAKDPPDSPPRSGALYGAGGSAGPAAGDLLTGFLDATAAPAPGA
ncbi:MAG: aminotransferase class V-fold PLP-dependent enzyme [bacterium]